MAAWIGIDGSHIDSVCGEDAPHTLIVGLNGTDYWQYMSAELPHWFILDLGESKNVTKVRGRSNHLAYDPVSVNIYVSDDTENWGVAVTSGISTWQDTDEWVEIETTPKEGQYVKVEITETEDILGQIAFGGNDPYYPIFDVYEGVGDGQYFNGLIDNVMLFDTTLNIDEVKALHHGGHGTEIAEVIDLDRRFNSRR